MLEIGELENDFMRDLILAAVAGIVHDECAGLLLLLDDAAHLGVGVARRRRLSGIGIPHHFLDQIVGITGCNVVGGLVEVLHVQVPVAVVTHEHQHVLPGPGIGIGGIADGFVYHGLGLFGRGDRETAHAHVEFV